MSVEDLVSIWECAEAARADCDRDAAAALAGYRHQRTEETRIRLSQALTRRDECRAALRSLAHDMQRWMAGGAAPRNRPSCDRNAALA